jgi:hypothetical protein
MGQPVLQGVDNGPTTHQTSITTQNGNEIAVLADPNTSGHGSLGAMGRGRDVGLLGQAHNVIGGIGVLGTSDNGVGIQGTGGAGGKTGVVGNGGPGGGAGVSGTGTSGGPGGAGGSGAGGVVGYGTADGVGDVPGVLGFGSGGGGGVVGNGTRPGVAGDGSGVVGNGSGFGPGVAGVAREGGTGVTGSGGPASGIGVEGKGGAAGGTGVHGVGGADAGTGVIGHGGNFNGAGVIGYGAADNGIGVLGIGAGGNGVEGNAYNAGIGVYGVVSSAVLAPGAPATVGVKAENPFGTALEVSGVASFSRSGTATIAVSASEAEVDNVSLLSDSSIVLATIQGNVADTYVQGVVVVPSPPAAPGALPGPGKFTIYVNQAVTADTVVGWFVIN